MVKALILVIFFSPLLMQAQEVTPDEGNTAPPKTFGYTFPFFPMDNDTMRALVVFCNYPAPSGSFDAKDLNPDYVLTDFWPGSKAQQLPSWADSVICPTTQNVWYPSMTAYFRDASFGKFWLIGDVYPELYVFNKQVHDYSPKKGSGIGYAVKELLQDIDADVDYSKYDRFDPFDYNNNSNRREPDGIVDLIFVIFRFNNSGTTDTYVNSYTGIAELGGNTGMFGDSSYITLDGMKILAGYPGSGVISQQHNPWEFGINVHEFAQHYSYGGVHHDMGSWNISGGSFPSADDRERLGWLSSPPIVPVSDTIITLRDYVTTGDFIKIPRNGYTLFLEHRRRISYFSSYEWHGWTWLESVPALPIQRDSGLFIYKKFGDSQFIVEDAGGRWEWKKAPDGVHYIVTDTPIANTFHKLAPAPLTGETVYNLYEKPAADINGVPYANRPTLSYFANAGDENTCFDIGGNEVYSPWSNPGIPINSPEDSLVVKLLRRDSEGNLVVQIYFKDVWRAKE
jgi:M6 family metalloprotease-like protein